MDLDLELDLDLDLDLLFSGQAVHDHVQVQDQVQVTTGWALAGAKRAYFAVCFPFAAGADFASIIASATAL